MKNIITILALLLSVTAFSQTLGNPQTIGQNSRNQKVGKGFQIEDTLLAKGIVRFSTLPTAGAADTFVNVSNTAGQLSKVGKSTFLDGISGGGSSFIPNGFKAITESRDLQADDAGYALVLLGENPLSLTIPYPSPLQVGESFIVVNQSDFSVNNSCTYNEDTVLLAPDEKLLFTTTITPGEGNPNTSLEVSTFIVDGEGGQPNKTALRYLMDKVENSIDLIALDYGDIFDAGGVQNIQVYSTGTGTGTASVDLLPTIQIGKDVTVSDLANNASTHNIQIDAGVGNTILVAGSAPSQTITLNTNGASVTIRKITSTQFMVISKL